MIFVTGDTHGDIDFAKLDCFKDSHPNLTKNDYVIICGDFGAVWDKKTLDCSLGMYQSLPFTVLFVDGNHENFELLNSYPIDKWNGGKVHKIKEDIIHLMRGQVFTIENKTFLTLGGATSTDKMYRRNRISWWEEEALTFDDLDIARENLAKYDNKVDYIITHACDEKSLYFPPLNEGYNYPTVYQENRVLENLDDFVTYKHWYFGHYHIDGDVNEKKTAIYNRIIEIS